MSTGESFLESAVRALHTPAEHHQMIARAAYYRAQRRGFEPGHELEDWLSAEQEVNAFCGLVEPNPRWDLAAVADM